MPSRADRRPANQPASPASSEQPERRRSRPRRAARSRPEHRRPSSNVSCSCSGTRPGPRRPAARTPPAEVGHRAGCRRRRAHRRPDGDQRQRRAPASSPGQDAAHPASSAAQRSAAARSAPTSGPAASTSRDTVGTTARPVPNSRRRSAGEPPCAPSPGARIGPPRPSRSTSSSRQRGADDDAEGAGRRAQPLGQVADGRDVGQRVADHPARGVPAADGVDDDLRDRPLPHAARAAGCRPPGWTCGPARTARRRSGRRCAGRARSDSGPEVGAHGQGVDLQRVVAAAGSRRRRPSSSRCRRAWRRAAPARRRPGSGRRRPPARRRPRAPNRS